MNELTRGQRALVGALFLAIGIVIVLIAAALGDTTDTTWPGVLLIFGLVALFGGAWLMTYTPRSQRRQAVGVVHGSMPVAPGWYPDPESPSIRFWDGSAWTDQRAPLPARGSSGPSASTIARGVALGIILVIVFFYFFGSSNSSDPVYCPPDALTASDCY